MARVAIGITTGHHTDAHLALGLEDAAVAHFITRLQLLHADELTAQTHGGAQTPICCCVKRMVGRTAIQGDAWAHPIRTHGGVVAVAQQSRAVGQAALTGQVLADCIEEGELFVHAHRCIRMSEMGHEGNLIHLRQGIQACPGRAKTLGCKTQSVHAAVHFQKHTLRHLCFVAAQHVDLRLGVHHMPKIQTGTQLQVALLKRAFQQQNGAAPIQLTQGLRLGQVEHCKTVGGPQPGVGPLNAMAISPRFDHRPDPRIRRSLLQASQVVAQSMGVNQGMNRTWHGVIVAGENGRNGVI